MLALAMCGIGGVVDLGAQGGVVSAAAALARVSSRLAARGPDGEGIWTSPSGRAALAHRRLSIIDLSERGAQPMLSADTRLAVTFNGEIYNYRALREELEAKGRRFRTQSDTEVLLHLYEERGDQMVHSLRGMFAFGLWDEARGGLLLARDPYGIKPLYHASGGGRLWFASQVKALLASQEVDTTVDPAGVVGFHLLGSVPEPFTWYRAVRALPAGSTLWIDTNQARTEHGVAEPKRYFSLAREHHVAAERPPPTDGERDALREALLDSARAHLVADVPVGVFLSSGIDSGALLGLLTEAGSRSLRAVTLAFDEHRDSKEDEAPLAAQVAAHYGAEHGVRRVDRHELEQDWPLLLDAMDQPSIDGLNTWFVSKAAREVGLKVAVSGLGGDELFGGYPAFLDVPRWSRLMRAPSAVPGLGVLVRRSAAPLLAQSGLASPKLAGMIELGGSVAGAWLLKRGLFMPWELTQVLDAELVREGLERLSPLSHVAARLDEDPGTDFGRVATLEASLYMRNQLLRDTDWASMAHGLEVRVPLVDVPLLRAVAPCLAHERRAGLGKRWLAGSVRPALPPAIVERRKTGFTTPIGRWLGEGTLLGGYREVPVLARAGCHWSRRLAHVVARHFMAGARA
jgi:asparagine synthase (glutamine-hydrolysing)